MQRREPIEAVLERHTGRLLSLPGVVGAAVGRCAGAPCIKLLVARRTPELDRALPRELEGYPVELEETGEIRALDSG